jgi:uncharacterized protein YndB with AHSA1/START domain
MSEVEQRVSDRDVHITRAFRAPRALVWRFWTEPAQLMKWFGPPGVSVQPGSVAVDLQEGGRWELTMVDDATGSAHPLRGRIERMVPEEYLEIAMSAETAAGAVEGVVLRVRFHDHGDRTRITLHQGPFSPEVRDMTADGWQLALSSLDTLLERNQE